MYKAIIDLLFETQCIVCKGQSESEFICTNCECNYIERDNYCKEFTNLIVFSWCIYQGKLRDAILRFKGGNKELSRYFSNKLFDFWNKIGLKISDKDYIVIPVPSHIKRTKERGYCQSSILAMEFSTKVNKKFLPDLAIRIKNTKQMNSLNNITERKENIKNAFKITGTYPKEKYILIIDDILTSGSTLQELARTILKVYPDKQIYGLTIASGDRVFIP